MITGTIIAEDIQVSFTRGEMDWSVTLCDGMTGKQATVRASDEEFGAAMALLIGGDSHEGIAALYPLAEKLHVGLPKELRMIP